MTGLRLLATLFSFLWVWAPMSLVSAQVAGEPPPQVAEPGDAPVAEPDDSLAPAEGDEAFEEDVPVAVDPVPVVAPAPEPPKERSPYDRGRVSVSLALGSQRLFDQTYFVAGGGLGYWVLSGVEVGFHAARWFGGDPGLTLLSPRARFVWVKLSGRIKPFVGGFLSRLIVDGPEPTFDTAGARLGIAWAAGGHMILNLGAVYETVVSDCDAATSTCSWIYPDVSISMSF